MRVLGIDPGQGGAFVILDSETRKSNHIVMPMLKDGTMIDGNQAAHFLIKNKDNYDQVFLEHVHAIYGSSAAGTFKFGRLLGGVEGVLHSLNIPYTLVPPKTWQKAVWIPELIPLKSSEMTAKEKSMKTVKQLYPELSFTMKMLRGDKEYEHDGLIDATLIAHYGIKINFDKNGV